MSFKFFTLLGFCFSSLSVLAAQDRIISISGECLRALHPNRASMTLTATFLDSDASRATQRASEQYEKLRAEIVKLKLKDVEFQSTEMSVQEEKDWVKNKEVSRGFRSRLGLEVSSSELPRMGELIKIAAQLGIREFSQLRTYISDSMMKTEKEACLEEAMKNARSKAEKMLKSVGARIGKLQSVSEDYSSVPMEDFSNYKVSAMAKQGLAESAPSVETKAQNIKVSLRVSFFID